MGDVIAIGRCIGCDKLARLDVGVCRGCLEDPRRGRAWSEMSHRCRVDRKFAAEIYAKIRTERGRAIFRSAYGVPRGD